MLLSPATGATGFRSATSSEAAATEPTMWTASTATWRRLLCLTFNLRSSLRPRGTHDAESQPHRARRVSRRIGGLERRPVTARPQGPVVDAPAPLPRVRARVAGPREAPNGMEAARTSALDG